MTWLNRALYLDGKGRENRTAAEEKWLEQNVHEEEGTHMAWLDFYPSRCEKVSVYTEVDDMVCIERRLWDVRRARFIEVEATVVRPGCVREALVEQFGVDQESAQAAARYDVVEQKVA